MNEVFSQLIALDVAAFRFLNQSLASAPGDAFFVFITETRTMAVPYLLLLAGVLFAGRRKGFAALLALAVVVLLCDQLSSFVVKPLVGRVRPCTALDGVRLLVGCGGGRSFPSSHAVNNFGAAYLLSAFFPRIRPYMYSMAGAVAFSRVYVGVHYPMDVIAGAVLGVLVAMAVAAAYDAAVARLPQSPWWPPRRHPAMKPSSSRGSV